MATSKAYEYEVRCPRCDVSFPTGTKKCLHCGGRTGPSHGRISRAPARAPTADFDPLLRPEPKSGASSDELLRPMPIDADPDEDEEATPRGGLLRAAVTVLWILAAIAFSVLRACQEGP